MDSYVVPVINTQEELEAEDRNFDRSYIDDTNCPNIRPEVTPYGLFDMNNEAIYDALVRVKLELEEKNDEYLLSGGLQQPGFDLGCVYVDNNQPMELFWLCKDYLRIEDLKKLVEKCKKQAGVSDDCRNVLKTMHLAATDPTIFHLAFHQDQ
jgi:hypothetical protein